MVWMASAFLDLGGTDFILLGDQQDWNLSPLAALNVVQIMICFGTRFLLL